MSTVAQITIRDIIENEDFSLYDLESIRYELDKKIKELREEEYEN